MKQLLSIFIFSVLIVHSDHAQSIFHYDFTAFSEPYVELTGATSINNGEIWDEPTYTIPMAFPFELNGHPVTTLHFNGHGVSIASSTGVPFVVSEILPFEIDLIDRGAVGNTSLSPMSYTVEGDPGSQIQKIEISSAGSYYEWDVHGTLNMYVNVQCWLFEGSNAIEFHYGPSFMDNPLLFYGGGNGPESAVTDYDGFDDVLMNSHFLIGSAPDPFLSEDLGFVNGTPASGTVYHFTYLPPISVTVNGTDGTSYCHPNGMAQAIVNDGVPPFSYSWNTGATTSSIDSLNAGTYSVTVEDNEGNTATGNVTISNVDPVTIDIAVTDETSSGANDGTAEAFPSGGLSPYTFEWSNGETTALITGLAPGLYTVTITDHADCAEVQTAVINVFSCPNLSLETGFSNVSCFGACDASIVIFLVNNGSEPFTYDWSNGGSTAGINNLCADLYTVTITDVHGCIVLGSFDITQPDPILVNAGSTAETLIGQHDGTAWASPTGGTPFYLYTWSNGSTDSLITNLAPGIYTVTVTDANQCSDIQTVTVEEGPCGILTAEVDDDYCFQSCYGIIFLHFPNAVQPVTYQWSNGATIPTLELLCAGDYTVTATDATGCQLIETYTIHEPALLVANAGSTNETNNLNDGTAWSTPTGGTAPYTYLWSNGSTDSLIVNLSPGTYFVSVSDYLGCDAVDSVTVAHSCTGYIEGFIENNGCVDTCQWLITNIVVDGSGGPYSYLWSTGDTTQATIDSLCPGVYGVTIQDAGCIYTSSSSIIQPEHIVATVDSVIHLTDSTTTAIYISVASGFEPYLFSWYGPNGFAGDEEDLIGIPPGFYTVQVYNTLGNCGEIDSIEVLDLAAGTSTLADWKLDIYPNPVVDLIYIEGIEATEYQIQLISTDGHALKTWSNTSILDVHDVIPGLYALRFSSDHHSLIKSIIISR